MSYIELLQDPAPSNALVRALKALLDAPTREEAKSVLARVQGIERGWEAADAQAARFGGKREAMKTLTPDTFNNMLRGEL